VSHTPAGAKAYLLATYMIPKDLSQYAFHLLRDIYAVEDLDKIDPKAFVDRLRVVHKGWSVEHLCPRRIHPGRPEYRAVQST
jgi:hypothetical protein